jgi:hypothetical protein
MRYVSILYRIICMCIFLVSISLNAQIIRQPYLQVLTPSSIMVRWNTAKSDTGKVYYGINQGSLTNLVMESDTNLFHKVTISGLGPSTKYYYSIDTLDGSDEQYFVTSPVPGSTGKTRIWVISDFGQTDLGDNIEREKAVNYWKTFNNGNLHSDFILSLGDQTENDTQKELQQLFFNLLDEPLLNSPLFTIEGNHDAVDDLVNYRATFSVPENGESGGYPSNTQDYYSFDYANIHIIALSTEIDDIDGAQLTWLRNDLQHIDKDKTDWLIACLHRPFHSGGYHPTDKSSTAQKQRTYWLKELEDCGVDLILQGHNAIYERSFLLDNLIGKTTDIIDKNVIDSGNGREDGDGAYYKGSGIIPHQGTIFIEVAPGGDAVDDNYGYEIFSSTFAADEYEGSVVIDVDSANRMDVYFLCNKPDAENNHLWDYFTIIKSDTVNTGFRTHELTPENCQIISYPNPFRSSTDIFYSLSQQGYVKIEIYNLLGQRLATLVNEIKNKGEYTVKWNAEDEKGNKIPGGVYIAQIYMGKVSKSIRMILLQ